MKFYISEWSKFRVGLQGDGILLRQQIEIKNKHTNSPPNHVCYKMYKDTLYIKKDNKNVY